MEALTRLLAQVEAFCPQNEQEQADKEEILHWLRTEPHIFSRENKAAHITVSAWIVDNAREKVLMAYHNLYNSWAWLGGHADGDADLKRVIRKEVAEESGLQAVRFLQEDIFSLEILPVSGHEKHGAYVSSHLHLNITYLLEADLQSPLRIKADENSRIGWISVQEIAQKSTEKWFVDRIYTKLCEKVRATAMQG